MNSVDFAGFPSGLVMTISPTERTVTIVPIVLPATVHCGPSGIEQDGDDNQNYQVASDDCDHDFRSLFVVVNSLNYSILLCGRTESNNSGRIVSRFSQKTIKQG